MYTRTYRKRRMTPEEQSLANIFPEGLDIGRFQFTHDAMIHTTVLNKEDPDRQVIQEKIFSEKGFDDHRMNRAIGSIMGLAVGDALGAPLEFSDVRYGSHELQDMGQESVWYKRTYNRFDLHPGQWTDDTSMALCLADSLLVRRDFDPRDLRLRFLNWFEFGYCNAFGNEEPRMGGLYRHSVGLGGNIGQSFEEFEQFKTDYTRAGDLKTSGNGSIMRLAPVPVYYWDQYEKALDVSYKQSKTTHQGTEAAECCRLLTHILLTAINHSTENGLVVPKSILDNLGSSFHSDVEAVQKLAQSEAEIDPETGRENPDRDWNWKKEEYCYSPVRAYEQPGYIGSYAMDNLSMALHCVYSTDSLEAACLKCANMRGDSDSVCAVVGQIAGAMYGCSAIPTRWIEYLQRWDNGDIALRAYKLFTKNPL